MKDEVDIYDMLFRAIKTCGEDCTSIQLSCGNNFHPVSYIQVGGELPLSDSSHPMS